MTPQTPITRAIERRDWDRAALYVLLAFSRVLRETPGAALEDLLAALTPAEESDDRRAR